MIEKKKEHQLYKKQVDYCKNALRCKFLFVQLIQRSQLSSARSLFSANSLCRWPVGSQDSLYFALSGSYRRAPDKGSLQSCFALLLCFQSFNHQILTVYEYHIIFIVLSYSAFVVHKVYNNPGTRVREYVFFTVYDIV